MLSRLQLKKEELREQRPESHPGAVRFLHPFSVPDNSPDSPAADRLSSLFCHIQRLHLIGPGSCICTADHSLLLAMVLSRGSRILHSPGVLSASLRPPSFLLLFFFFFCLFSFSSSLFLRPPSCCFSSFWPYVLRCPRILSLDFSFYPIPLVTSNSSFKCSLSIY